MTEIQMPLFTPPRLTSLPLLSQFSTILLNFPLSCARPCDRQTVLYFFPPERDIDPKFGASSSVEPGGRSSKSVESAWDWEI